MGSCQLRAAISRYSILGLDRLTPLLRRAGHFPFPEFSSVPDRSSRSSALSNEDAIGAFRVVAIVLRRLARRSVSLFGFENLAVWFAGSNGPTPTVYTPAIARLLHVKLPLC